MRYTCCCWGNCSAILYVLMPANVAHTPRQQSTQTATSFLLADQPQLFRWSMQFLPSKD